MTCPHGFPRSTKWSASPAAGPALNPVVNDHFLGELKSDMLTLTSGTNRLSRMDLLEAVARTG